MSKKKKHDSETPLDENKVEEKKEVESEKDNQEENNEKDSKENKEEASETENTDTVEEEASELETLKEELDKKQDQFLRLSAEYDNYRRRTAGEKDNLRKNANAELLTEILPVLDNLERALAQAEDSPILDGVVMIQKQLLEILQRQGLEEAGKAGDAFDPKFHNAVMQEQVDGTEPNIILEVLQKGYVFGDKLLRAAMVKVSG